MGEVNYVTGEEFQEDVLDSETPVLLDFTAAWCGPCKMLAPVMEELADEWAGKIKIYKVDVDKDNDIAKNYGVMSVPTLMLFVNGEEAERLTGFRPKKRLMKKFEGYL